MIGKLEYDLNDNDERQAFQDCLNAGAVLSGLHEFSNVLRTCRKHRELSNDQIILLQELTDAFYVELGEYLS